MAAADADGPAGDEGRLADSGERDGTGDAGRQGRRNETALMRAARGFGAEEFCAIRSYLATAARHCISTLKA